MKAPSAQWSAAERSRVIKRIAEKLEEAAKQHQAVPSAIVADYAERIRFLVKLTPEWLEANRSDVLKGL